MFSSIFKPRVLNNTNNVLKSAARQQLKNLATASALHTTRQLLIQGRALSSSGPLPTDTRLSTETKKGWGRGFGIITSLYLFVTFLALMDDKKRWGDYEIFAGEYINPARNKQPIKIIHDNTNNRLVIEGPDGTPIELEQIRDARFRNRADGTEITFNLEPNTNTVHSITIKRFLASPVTLKRSEQSPTLRLRV